MPRTPEKPTLLQDVSAVAGLYVDVLRLMGKRITGKGVIVTYTPPGDPPDISACGQERRALDKHPVHTGH